MIALALKEVTAVLDRFGNASRMNGVAAIAAMMTLCACGGGGGGGGSADNAAPSLPSTPGSGQSQVDSVAPSPPTSLSVAATAVSAITISWSGASDNVAVVGYKVYRDATATATVTSTTHTENGLAAGTQYCYDVTAVDAAGNESTHSSVSCATTATPDTTAPTIAATEPANGEVGFAIDAPIKISFNEPIDPASLTAANFIVTDADETAIAGSISVSESTATFTPDELLAASEEYTITLAAEVRDLAGNALGTDFSASFTTGLALYEITAIGSDFATANEQSFTLLNDLNEQGDVAGESVRIFDLDEEEPTQESIAFLWRDGALIDLGSFDVTAPPDSRAQGVNDSREVVGITYPGVNGDPAFLWQTGEMTAVAMKDAYAINNAGHIVGYVDRIDGVEIVGVAVVWKSGVMTDLEGLVNPWNINDAGDIVGFSEVSERPQASFWRDGDVTLLGLLPNALSSQAFDINSRGQIIGTTVFGPPATTTSYNRAFLWDAGELTELPRLASAHASSHADGINDRGDIVGRSGSALQTTATVWFDGEVYDLNTLVSPEDPLKAHVTLLEAREINNRGQIIVQGTDARHSGSFSGYLLTPTRARAQ